MKKILMLAFIFPLIGGCLTFNTLTYKIVPEDEKSGKAEVVIRDIRSDARTETEFREDTTKLFGDYLYGNELVNSLKQEGKHITSRQLKVESGKLNAYVSFNYDEITNIESLMYDEGFFYLTLPLADSVVSTNGQIIVSDEYQRIIWDKDVDTLKFEMFSISFDDGGYRELSRYYKK